MADLHKRSFAKALSWRVLATITTTVLVFLFTGNISLSLGVGIAEFIAKNLLYYIHERVWGTVSWGRVPHPLSNIPVEKELKPEDMKQVVEQLKDLGYID